MCMEEVAQTVIELHDLVSGLTNQGTTSSEALKIEKSGLYTERMRGLPHDFWADDRGRSVIHNTVTRLG